MSHFFGPTCKLTLTVFSSWRRSYCGRVRPWLRSIGPTWKKPRQQQLGPYVRIFDQPNLWTDYCWRYYRQLKHIAVTEKAWQVTVLPRHRRWVLLTNCLLSPKKRYSATVKVEPSLFFLRRFSDRSIDGGNPSLGYHYWWKMLYHDTNGPSTDIVDFVVFTRV